MRLVFLSIQTNQNSQNFQRKGNDCLTTLFYMLQALFVGLNHTFHRFILYLRVSPGFKFWQNIDPCFTSF